MSGYEHLPPGQGYVIAANHIGRLDAALAYYVLDRSDIIMVVVEKYEKYASQGKTGISLCNTESMK
jgi:hypothetical protein